MTNPTTTSSRDPDTTMPSARGWALAIEREGDAMEARLARLDNRGRWHSLLLALLIPMVMVALIAAGAALVRG